MSRLNPIELPRTICGPLTLLSVNQDKTKETLDKLAKEAENLLLVLPINFFLL